MAFFYRDIVKGVEKVRSARPDPRPDSPSALLAPTHPDSTTPFQVGQSAPSLEDFTCELLDMVRPVDLDRFTLKDLINCRMGHTVVSVLIDVNAFWLYENRENLMNSPDPEYDDEGESEGQMDEGEYGGVAGEAQVGVEEL